MGLPSKACAIIFCLVMITAGCSSNDTSTTNTANAPAAVSPATMAQPRDIAFNSKHGNGESENRHLQPAHE